VPVFAYAWLEIVGNRNFIGQLLAAPLVIIVLFVNTRTYFIFAGTPTKNLGNVYSIDNLSFEIPCTILAQYRLAKTDSTHVQGYTARVAGKRFSVTS
jgi:hypothetical protein